MSNNEKAESMKDDAALMAALVGEPVDPGRPLDQKREDYWSGDAGPKTASHLKAAGLPAESKSPKPWIIGIVLLAAVAALWVLLS